MISIFSTADFYDAKIVLLIKAAIMKDQKLFELSAIKSYFYEIRF